MEKKIRVTLNKSALDIIDSDVKSFKITKNYLINYIFYYLKDEKIKTKYREEAQKGIIQFNLNKKNKEIYYDFLVENKIQVEADFIRKLIYNYISQSKNNRELFVFNETINRISYAIENKRLIRIRFKDKRETHVLPFHIGSSKLELANYLFCYDTQDEIYKNYKICNIESIYITKITKEWKNTEKIKNIIKNFDPFLSQGQEIEARLTEKGIILLENLAVNRPKTLNINGDIYTFRCSDIQAKRYFSCFLDDIEILKPLELRNWFIERFKKALKNYGE